MGLRAEAPADFATQSNAAWHDTSDSSTPADSRQPHASHTPRRNHSSSAQASHTPQASMNRSPPPLLPSVLTTATPNGVNR